MLRGAARPRRCGAAIRTDPALATAAVAARRQAGGRLSPPSPRLPRWTTRWSASSAQSSLIGAPASSSVP
eukprot:1896942-Alexandrium_andersonii.AAC.1